MAVRRGKCSDSPLVMGQQEVTGAFDSQSGLTSLALSPLPRRRCRPNSLDICLFLSTEYFTSLRYQIPVGRRNLLG